ncbi:MAG TPA: ABC transporter permease subunit [Candidatus Babeliales bacterium]|nr:ABC transporter permease subunit [Candidatus Babeliales bacterium]
MIPGIKAEFKKLLSVRSTYILMLGFLLLGAFISFYVHGYKDSGLPNITGQSPQDQAGAALFLASSITSIPNILSVAGALIALLLLAHEYRYNTIVYTLTASNSRSKVLASKIIAIFCLVFVYTLVSTAILLGLVLAGVAIGGHSLPHQDINYLVFFAKSIFFAESFAMAGLLFIALIRNQVGAIAALLILPNTIEGLLSLLLKNNSVYMPFTALQQVIQGPVIKGARPAHPDNPMGTLSALHGAEVFLVYLVVAWVVTWYLFLKRDAT